MEALLPDSGAAGCPALSAATLSAIAAGLAGHTRQTAIELPKVSLSSKLRMNSLLSGLGMGVAFTSSADFSALSPQACCIAFVQHAATLRVGEKGTVASAATAVGILPGAAQLEVAFNRPYVLLVTDTRTGEPLFLARVANPLAG